MSALVVLQREVRASARLWLVAAVAFFAGFQLLQLALLIIRFQALPNRSGAASPNGASF